MDLPRHFKQCKVIVNFSHYNRFRTEDVEIALPVIPRKGEWFFGEKFLDEEDRTKFEEMFESKGVFYVREIWHDFDKDSQIITIILAMTDDDDGYYKKNFA